MNLLSSSERAGGTLRSTLAALAILAFAIPAPAAGATGRRGERNARALLGQALKEQVPAKRIPILDKALNALHTKPVLRSRLFFERGKAHKELGDCFRAVKDFDSALRHAPDEVPVLAEKTRCLIEVDQLDRASSVLERALSAQPRLSRLYVMKGMIYERRGFLSKAEDEYTRALHYEPDSAPALTRRTHVLLREGKPRDALGDLDALARLEPKNADVFMTRARVKVKLKEYQAALKDYSLAEKFLKDHSTVIKEKVLVYFKTGAPQKALNALAGHRVDDATDLEWPVLQARAHILLGNGAKAETLLSKVLRKNPSYAPAHLFSGVIAMSRSKWDEALADLNRAIDLDHSLVEAYKKRARVFMELKEPVRATADLTAAVDVDPSDGEIYQLRGRARISRLLYDAATEDFSRALDCLPNDPRILYDRAVAHALKEEWEPAIADLNAALAVKPAAARALALRAVVRFRQGRPADARNDFDAAVRADPSDATIRNNRGFFHYKTGDYKSAVKDLNRALQLDPRWEKARFNLNLALKRGERAGRAKIGSGLVPENAEPDDTAKGAGR
jgi:tetratricopeptide (TPR) repeat protein